EQVSKRLLRERDAVACTVLRMEQPASRAFGNRVEGVARGRLHRLRGQIAGEAAEEIANEGRASLRFLQRFHRNAICGTPDEDRRACKSWSVTATDNATASTPFSDQAALPLAAA